MGCALTKTEDEYNSGQARFQADDFCVFVPGLRLPRSLELERVHCDNPASLHLINRLDTVHSKIVIAAEELVLPRRKLRKKRSSHNVISSICQLREALEAYLPVLLRILKKEPELSQQIVFAWTNQEDEMKETNVQNPYYELLSVLQMLGMLSLLEANKAIIFKHYGDSSQIRIIEENKKTAIDILMKAAQLLECAVTSILPQAPHHVKILLPADLNEGVLHALHLQALGQSAEIQLGLAIDNAKATMAVKRRLACEVMKYWQQAYEKLQNVQNLGNGWGEKHILFVKWKHAEAKAAAYYYHGLILNESMEKQRARSCLEASQHFFKESETSCENFSSTAPLTRSPLWGPMKYISQKIREDFGLENAGLDIKALQSLPQLPDFPLALQTEEYDLPLMYEEEIE